ncbi:Y+L amino acid transporter 2 [Aphelenchoides besseyi]|nr:Y+L amino acid transporter 2 [Aphelenchoides besseyi]
MSSGKRPGNVSPTKMDKQRLNKPETKSETATVGLKQKISLFNGCAIIIGVIVGSGIFVSPKGVLMHTGSAPYSLAIWLACGLFSLCGALCYAELGTTIPKSGGDYAYIYEAFGKVPAFLFLWISLIIVNPTSIAVMALTFSSYILQPFYDGCEPSDFVTRVLASSVISIFEPEEWNKQTLLVILTIINCYSVRWSTRTQDVSTIAKLGALVVIILAGVVYVALGNVENLRMPKTNSIDLSLPQIALAFYQGVFSYSGWNYLNFVTEEIKEPYKNLPRAIYISLPVVTIIYMAVNCAYFAVLTPEEVLESPAVAFTFANRVLGPIRHLMPLFVAISCIGSVNGIIFTSSRMFFAGARDGQLPELLAMISIRYMTPVPSLVILAVLSVLMLNFADVLVLINYLSFSESSVVAMSILALVKMRIYNPELPRPIRASGRFYKMSEKNEVADEVEEVAVDKHDKQAVDMANLTDFNADKDDLQSDGAGNVDHLKADAAKVISLRAEDVKLLMNELELNKSTAERYLIKHRGEIRSALNELLGIHSTA